jgi:hypothetical protein
MFWIISGDPVTHASNEAGVLGVVPFQQAP